MSELERFARLDALFQGAVGLAPQARAGWLDEQCADDPQLRAEVEALLDEDAAQSSRSLESIVDAGWARAAADTCQPCPEPGEDPDRTRTQSPSGVRLPSPAIEAMPDQVGPYRILGRLGRGGMATVYLAEREGEFSMPVALKRIRRGMDTDDIVGRLRLEREILARLVHPNICRIYDGGSDEGGRPYLVMEVIEGQRIDDWCRQKNLSLRARLELFERVCAAVGYAHQNLVLHRDLKPSNILVTTEGSPKLLDFGIAKLLQGSGSEASAPTLTRLEDRLLTPEYASPEQFFGRPLNTAGDVYSLGVLLYQLASGRLPHQEEAGSNPLALAMARQSRDPKPVSESAQGARAAGVELAPAMDRFTARHQGELDAVTAKALEIDPTKRYGTVAELAEDLRRLMSGQPVMARHQTWAYRTLKLIRRHRTGAVLVTLLATSMIAAVVGTSWQASVAEQERARAEEKSRQAQSVVSFLTQMFEVSDPYSTGGLLAATEVIRRGPLREVVTAGQLLDAGAQRIGADLKADPLARAEVERAIAQAYMSLYSFDEARAQLENARAELTPLADDSPAASAGLAAVLRELGTLEARQGQFAESEKLLLEAEHRFSALGTEKRGELAVTLERLGELERLRGRLQRAEEILRRAVTLHLAAHGEGSVESSQARAGLARVIYRQGRAEEASECLRQVLHDLRRWLNDHHPLVLEVTNDLAVSSSRHDPAEGQRIFEQLLERQKTALGPEHADLVPTLYNLATNLRNRRLPEQAEARLQEAWTLAEQKIPSSRVAGQIRLMWGRLRENAGDLDSAIQFYGEALDIRRQLLRPGDLDASEKLLLEATNAQLHLGSALLKANDPRGESMLREVLATTDVTSPRLDPPARVALADYALAGGRWGDVLQEVEEGLQRLQQRQESKSVWVGALLQRRAQALWQLGQKEEARSVIDRAVTLFSEKMGTDHEWTQSALQAQEKMSP